MGRLSSTRPNLTAMPGKRQGERGKFFRTIFVPDQGEWVEADYSLCEIRIAAHYSGAELWKKAFAEGVDLHQAVADELKISRPHAKAINLGLVMGLGQRGLHSSTDRRAPRFASVRELFVVIVHQSAAPGSVGSYSSARWQELTGRQDTSRKPSPSSLQI